MLTKEEMEIIRGRGCDQEDLEKLCDMALLALEEKALVRQMLEALKASKAPIEAWGTNYAHEVFEQVSEAIAAAEKFLGEK